jgi:TolB-like protein
VRGGRHRLGDWAEKPVLVETMARSGYRFIAPASAPGQPAVPSTPPVTVHSIAVLPFENATADPEADYLVDGLTEGVINALSRLPALRVLARSTVFRYRGKPVDCRTVGRKLCVGAVLLGRVSRRGDQLVIGTELVEVQSGWLIWGEQFSHDVSDVLLIEEELSVRISEKLRSELAGKANAPARRQTQNTEAYQEYLKGRYHWNRMTREGLQQSIDYYQRALQKDPDFALAYAGLADSYHLLGFFEMAPPAEVMPKAKQCAVKAVEIDGDLAEACASLAGILKAYDRDWVAAERWYRQALQLNPNNAHAYRGYAALLSALGRFDESLVQIRHAQELDPLSIVIGMELAWNLFIAREYDHAIEQALRVTHFDPASPSAQYILGLACQQKGKFADARAAIEQSVAGSHGHPSGLASLGHLSGVTGDVEGALRMLDQLKQLASNGYVAAFWNALVHAGLGDVNAAIDDLERGYAESDAWLVWINTEPRLDNLRADTRFQQLLRRVGFGAQAAGA